MKLVIVESPGKCKTIQKYLGSEYQVLASFGHIRDLDDKQGYYGIDVKTDFQPHFSIMPSKAKQVAALRRAVQRAEKVYIASDDDREGEAIGWHLAQVLKLDPKTTPRILFREISESALKQAIAEPGLLNVPRVQSQQTRQILDKLVGYGLSPLLWRHIQRGLSAGRVQSVVTRLVIDREREINDFSSQGYYTVSGRFFIADIQNLLPAKLNRRLGNYSEAQQLLSKAQQAQFQVGEIQRKEEKREPTPPLITSSMQQAASGALQFGTKKTMSVAQKLYEKGKITYMRTDSTHIAPKALSQAEAFIKHKWGPEFHRRRIYSKRSKGAQEAHECIRPTNVREEHLSAGNGFTGDEIRLYRLIWRRFLASQMSPELLDVTIIPILIYPSVSSNTDETVVGQKALSDQFQSRFEEVLFPGFKILEKSPKANLETNQNHNEKQTETHDQSAVTAYYPFKEVKQGDPAIYYEILAEQSFTEPPARFSEASLVRELERRGIGRPSTFASMVTKIQDRKYVSKENLPSKSISTKNLRLVQAVPAAEDSSAVSSSIQEIPGKWRTRAEHGKLVPTDIGHIVTRFLLEHFQDLLDYDFTSEMESKLDQIAQGNLVWNQIIKEYWEDFNPRIAPLMKTGSTGAAEGTGSTQEKQKYQRHLGEYQGEPVYTRLGRYGPCLQIGGGRDGSQARYLGLPKGLSIETVQLQDVLSLLQFPRALGEGIQVKSGPYGYYLEQTSSNKQMKPKRISIPDSIDPAKINLERAQALLSGEEPVTRSHPNLLLDFPKEQIQVWKGKYGPYIKSREGSTSLGKRKITQIKRMNLSQIQELIRQKYPGAEKDIVNPEIPESISKPKSGTEPKLGPKPKIQRRKPAPKRKSDPSQSKVDTDIWDDNTAKIRPKVCLL